MTKPILCLGHLMLIVVLLGGSECLMASETNFGESPTPSSKVVNIGGFNTEACFDKIWQIVDQHFWDPNFNGIDWKETGRRYRPLALSAGNHESFAVIINQMLAELKTSHTRYFTKWEADYYTLQAVLISQRLAAMSTSDTSILEKSRPGLYSSQAKPHRAGIGIITKKIEDRYYVNRVLAGSPAEKAALMLGDLLLQVDGKPYHPIRSFMGRANEEVELVLQRDSSLSSQRIVKIKPVDRDERTLFETDSATRTCTMEYQGHKLVYMPLCWLSGWRMRNVLDKGYRLACQSEGMIIDLRYGFGGGPPIEYIDPFLRNDFRELVITSTGRNHQSSFQHGYKGPVIVIINSRSRSGKELLAYFFKKTGRAILLGEKTAGYITAGTWKRISSESLLYCCVAMLDVGGERLEGVGIEPDIEVKFDIRFAAGEDIQLERARQEIVRMITVQMGNPR